MSLPLSDRSPLTGFNGSSVQEGHVMQTFRLSTGTSVLDAPPVSGLNTTHVTIHMCTHTTCIDLHQHLVEVGPVHQEVVMCSVREDSQHAGYRHW